MIEEEYEPKRKKPKAFLIVLLIDVVIALLIVAFLMGTRACNLSKSSSTSSSENESSLIISSEDYSLSIALNDKFKTICNKANEAEDNLKVNRFYSALFLETNHELYLVASHLDSEAVRIYTLTNGGNSWNEIVNNIDNNELSVSIVRNFINNHSNISSFSIFSNEYPLSKGINYKTINNDVMRYSGISYEENKGYTALIDVYINEDTLKYGISSVSSDTSNNPNDSYYQYLKYLYNLE